MVDSSSDSKEGDNDTATQHSLRGSKARRNLARACGLAARILGALGREGVNVAIFSENAERVELCLFDEQGERETARIALPEYTNQKWHGYFPDLRPGQSRPSRLRPLHPKGGHRFNHNKLLLDPYAKRL